MGHIYQLNKQAEADQIKKKLLLLNITMLNPFPPKSPGAKYKLLGLRIEFVFLWNRK